MKTIILEDGTRVEISDESYQALQKAVTKPVWEDIKERTPVNNLANFTFSGWGGSKQSWLNNEQSKKEFEIYLHMLLWKDTYDKDFVPDWGDEFQSKWYIYYDHIVKSWGVSFYAKYQDIMQVYVSTEEKAKQMLEDLKSIGVL